MLPLDQAKEFQRKKEEFVRRIVEWYRTYGQRDLPWRNTDDPWAVLVAALFLRKTTREQVLKVYPEFLKKYPTPESVLRASIDEIRNLIKPLGIEHQRAEQIIEIARFIVERFRGSIPCSKELLKKLPGVGDYIANEVLLNACKKPVPLLDRNMIRVIERVFGFKSTRSRPHTDPKMWRFAESLMPKDPQIAKELNYGIMDLANVICTDKNPKCSTCPLKDICVYYKETFTKTMDSKQ